MADGNVSTALLGVGAAAVIAGSVLWFTAPSSKPQQAAWSLAPLVSPHVGGVGVSRVW